MKLIRLLAVAALVLTSGLTSQLASAAPRDIYPDASQAKADLAAALKTAAAQHKRILLDFGGNWCGDCKVLDIYLHTQQNLPLLEKSYVLVHINVGHFDANTDIAAKYNIPLEKGVPALAVLNERGKLLYSQTGGEFESMRHMDPSSVTTFLSQWKPEQKGCSVVAVSC